MLFSIVIPSYNVEKYICACVDSVLNQKYSGDYEIIIVDDGSTDSTLNILMEYDKLYESITVIFQENDGAPGKARNQAIEIAKGDYLLFLDSDDILPETALTYYYDTITRTNHVDIIYGDTVRIDEQHAFLSRDKNPQTGCFDNVDFIMNSMFRFVARNASAKVFRAALVKENNIRFPEKVPGQDSAFTFMCLAFSKTIIVSNQVVYHRLIREDETNVSLTQSFSLEAYKKRLIAAQTAIDFFKIKGPPSTVYMGFLNFLRGSFARVVYLDKNYDHMLPQLRKELLSFYQLNIKDGKVVLSTDIFYVLFVRVAISSDVVMKGALRFIRLVKRIK